MTTSFYSAFEAQFRGPRELIAQRLKIYGRFLAPLARFFAGGAALDLGCGRGEWMEFAQAAGLKPVGIDMDAGMLSDCTQRGLDVRQGDALDHLSSLPSNSQALVSAFHLAEHLTFDQVWHLVSESLRVLQPGGLLIIETPNAENIVVGSSFFYMDPTHQKPLHSELLGFVMQSAGFSRSALLRLNEDPALAAKEYLSVLDVLTGVSPDLAIVAQKAGAPEMLAAFDEAFEGVRGRSLASVAKQYDHGLQRRFDALRVREEATRSQAEHLSRELENLRSEVVKLQLAMADLKTSNFQRLYRSSRSLAGRSARRSLPVLRQWVAQRPWAKRIAGGTLRSFPFLARWIGRFLTQPVASAPPILHFEDLHSARLMQAVTAIPNDGPSVTFLDTANHGR